MSMTNGETREFGDLRVLTPANEIAPKTLVIFVHGWRGNPESFKDYPERFLADENCHVGLWSYQTGFRVPQFGVRELAHQLVQDSRDAARGLDCRQLALVAHSQGALVTAMAASQLVSDGDFVVTGILNFSPAYGILGLPGGRKERHPLPKIVPLRQIVELYRSGGFYAEEASRILGSLEPQLSPGAIVEVVGRADVVVNPPTGLPERVRWQRAGHSIAAFKLGDAAASAVSQWLSVATASNRMDYLNALRLDLGSGRWAIRRIDRSEASPNGRYVIQPAQKVSDVGDRSQPTKEELALVDDVRALLGTRSRGVMLVGPAGYGKSTAITHLGLAQIEAALRSAADRLPIVIRLGRPSDDPHVSWSGRLAAIGHSSAFVHCARDLSELFQAAAGAQQLLVLIDGLDEATESQIAAVRQLHADLAPSDLLIAAGRPHSAIRPFGFDTYELSALSVELMAAHALERNRATAFVAWSSGAPTHMRRVPRTFGLLATIWVRTDPPPKPPANEGELFTLSLPWLLAKQRDLSEPLTPAPPAFIRRAVSVLGSAAFTQLAGRDQDESSSPLALPGLTPEDIDRLQDGGILERIGTLPSFQFIEESWREFFAAAQLVKLISAGDRCAHLARPSWLRVWLFAASDPQSREAVVAAATGNAPAFGALVSSLVTGTPHKLSRYWLPLVQSLSGWPTAGPISSLMENERADVRSYAAGGLRGTDDHEVLLALVDLLSDKRKHVHQAASLALRGTRDPVVLSTLTARLGSSSWKIRRPAARALQGTEDTGAIQAAITGLASRHVGIRRTSVVVLRGTKDANAISALCEALSDKDARVREDAAIALWNTTDPNALSALTEHVSDVDPRVRLAAANGLRGTTNPTLLSALVDQLEGFRSPGQRGAALALRGTGDTATLMALIELISSDRTEVRSGAATALSGVDHSDALALLRSRLDHPRAGVREAAARALSGTPNASCRTALAARLADPSISVRRNAAYALRGAKPGSADHDALVPCLEDTSHIVREAAAIALRGTTDGAARVALQRRLSDPAMKVRTEAAFALQGHSDESSEEALVAVLRADERPLVRRAAALALTGTENPDAIRALVESLTSGGQRVRQAAAKALKGTRNQTALRALVDRLNDSQTDVRRAAAISLRGTDDSDSLMALLALVDGDAADPAGAAALALRDCEDAETLAKLRTLLSSERDHTRRAAEHVLRFARPDARISGSLGPRNSWLMTAERLIVEDVSFDEWPTD